MLKRAILGGAFVLLTTASASAADKVTVLLDWFVSPSYAPILVADWIGAYKDAGLDVEIVPPADPAVPPRLVAAGQADIALIKQPQLHLLVEEGLPVVRIGTLMDQPLDSICTLGSKGIKSIADFKGKKIGYSVSGVETAAVTALLESADLKLSDVTLMNVNFNLVSALAAGEVDGVIGCWRNLEVFSIRDLGEEPIVFEVEKYGVPMYDELIFIANKEKVSDPKIKKFLEALKKGGEHLSTHPEEAWKTFTQKYPDLNNEFNRKVWQASLSTFAEDPITLDRDRYTSFADWLRTNKLIKRDLPLEDYAVELN